MKDQETTQRFLEASIAAEIATFVPAWLNGTPVDVNAVVAAVVAVIVPTLEVDGSALVTSVGISQVASAESAELTAGLASLLGPGLTAEVAAARHAVIIAPAGARRRRISEVESQAVKSWAAVAAVGAATFALSVTRELMLAAGLAAVVGTLNGHVERTWVTRHDAKVRPAHAEADGSVSPLGGTFPVGGVPMRFPGDPQAPLMLTINCRCHLSYALKRQPVTKGAAA